MLPTNLISDQQFRRARELSKPVRVTGPASFVLPSATRPELTEHHQVTFDSAEQPAAFACSCEAFGFNQPCWAAARALDILVLFSAHGVTLSAPFEPEAGGVGGATSPADSFDADGRTEFAVSHGGPLPRPDILVCKRTHKGPEPEGDPDAVLVAYPIRKVGKVEKVRGWTI